MIRIREVDPHTQEAQREYDLPFKPGPFAWGDGQAHLHNLFDLGLSWLSGGKLPAPEQSGEVLSQPGDPFKLVVRKHLPASAPAVVHQADPSGDPMAQDPASVQGPRHAPGTRGVCLRGRPVVQARAAGSTGRPRATRRPWSRSLMSNRPELVEDFLKPPLNVGPRGMARFRYADKTGKDRSFDLPLEGQEGKTTALPDSDLSVKVEKVADFPTSEGGLFRILGEAAIPVGMFQVRKGDGPEVEHVALAGLPMVPNVMPSSRDPEANPKSPLVSINLMVPPELDPKTNGRFGQIEVLAGPDRALYYRVFGRGKDGKTELRSAGPLAEGKTIDAFGGGANMPMTISFRVDDYMPSGVERQIYEPVDLAQEPDGRSGSRQPGRDDRRRQDQGRSGSSDKSAPEGPSFKPVAFGDQFYEIAYDVDRKPLGFELKLDDFEVGFEPGTEQATKFVSKVRLNDSSEGIRDRPYTISMNEPMTHRGYTFYQSRYSPIVDPDTRQRTGQFQSVFQVGVDPGRPIKYVGCVLLVMGIFPQFYMRAGVFTDGGKRERQRAAKKANTQTLTVEKPQPSGPDEEIL